MKKYKDHQYADCPEPNNHHKAAHRLVPCVGGNPMFPHATDEHMGKCLDAIKPEHTPTHKERCGQDERFDHECIPLSWSIGKNLISVFIISDEDDPKAYGRTIADLGPRNERNLANAAFIVRAVNCHEELVQRSKELIARFNNLENLYFKETGFTRGEGLAGEVIHMKEAIAKAEGK